MNPGEDFYRSVFINCPYDDDYVELQHALIFTIMLPGLNPIFASENTDCSNVRIQTIKDIIISCRYSIHDLSRVVAEKAGDYSRMNMPFELGLDCGCKEYSDNIQLKTKTILVLEKNKYGYQRALSDFSGIDIFSHQGNIEKLIKILRSWLLDSVTEISNLPGESAIWNWYYADFHYFMSEEARIDLLTEKEIWSSSVNQFKKYVFKFYSQFEEASKYLLSK